YNVYSNDGTAIILSAENDQADLAILRIVGTQPSNDTHPSLKLAYNDEVITRGMEVALVGSPQGVQNSISVGVVSQTGITISTWGAGTFIMTDAAINGGNSGGPMVNSLGNVVGVVESKIVSTEIDNMGFALSVDTLRSFLSWASQAAHNELGENLTLALK
ncbi:MAG: trypsin-like peptidase domain-containing protein, partial [Clostridia bacterium]|nr:trypsin-like peptidase domain-containing protein [Clostridia bacterium]